MRNIKFKLVSIPDFIFGKHCSIKINLTICFLLIFNGPTFLLKAAPEANLWQRWTKHQSHSKRKIDHNQWAIFLDRYLIINDKSNINLMRYSQVTKKDRKILQNYLRYLEDINISHYSRPEQFAYWINHYNARTVELILENYPIDSIKDISFSFFSFGPWDEELITVEGIDLSLNDIEHRILRPIWKDPRIHYAVNCASMSCPNLLSKPFTAETSEMLLDEAAKGYVNHPRGVRFEDKKLMLSKIFDWYLVDFGGSTDNLLKHILKYSEPHFFQKIKHFKGKPEYVYDWQLNEKK
jgi:hypothetical protein